MKTLLVRGVQGPRSIPLAVPIHVECEGSHCLAYRDETGAWRNFPAGELLSGEVHRLKYQEALEADTD